jgi:hypothetical protein
LNKRLRINPNIRSTFTQLEAENPNYMDFSQDGKFELMKRTRFRITKYKRRGFEIPEAEIITQQNQDDWIKTSI